MLKSALLWLVCLGVVAIAQVKPETLAAVDAGALNGRVYSNKLLGFSCEIPKGWTSQNRLFDQAQGSRTVIDRLKASLRNQGILLIAENLPENARGVPLIVLDSVRPAPGPNAVAIFVENMIVSAELSADATPPDISSILVREFDRIRPADPKLQTTAPDELVIDGQEILRMTFFSPKQKRHGCFAVAVRRGYLIKFLLNSRSEKDLAKLMKAMETFHFEPTSDQ